MVLDNKKENKKESCSCLEDLKREYEPFKTKYNLPDFYELNRLFDIEDIDVDTDFLLRRIRRIIADRVAGYSRFVDFMLNPSNGPIFFFKLLKKLDNKDKEMLTEVYETLGNFEMEILVLDLDYNEEKEADFIKRIFDKFNREIRLKFLEIVKKMSNSNSDKKKEGNVSYFG